GCLTVWELQGDTIRHLGVTPVSYDDEKHKKFLIRIGKHKIDTPHCFFNAVDGDEDEERHRIWCYCLRAVKEACASQKSIGEAIYQWKRDSSSRVNMKIRGRSTSMEVVKSALNAFSKIVCMRIQLNAIICSFVSVTSYSYNVSLGSCKLSDTEISADGRILIFVNKSRPLVAVFEKEEFMTKDSETRDKLLLPLAVLRGQYSMGPRLFGYVLFMVPTAL
uniref:Uncharacterized protein n=1 Tax=Caenorhabditis japonica TaxID=281687 RepID=A0A8R1IH41_CAEJA